MKVFHLVFLMGPEINFWHIRNKKVFKNIKERDTTVVHSFFGYELAYFMTF